MTNAIALYTTVHPGVAPYFLPWYKSVQLQTDSDFELWIGVDQIHPDSVQEWAGRHINAHWYLAGRNSTPAQIRQGAINAILAANRYCAIVFVDCDDILDEARVESARNELRMSDVNACALTIMQEDGTNTDLIFTPPSWFKTPHSLARANIFGLSNTAYDIQLLRQIPMVPDGCILFDWFLATAAWGYGARLSFDPASRMHYRQYARNTARVLPPFTAEYVGRATKLALAHYDIVLSRIPYLSGETLAALREARATVVLFSDRVVENCNLLQRYLYQLNELPPSHVWWDCVAHPLLDNTWKS